MKLVQEQIEAAKKIITREQGIYTNPDYTPFMRNSLLYEVNDCMNIIRTSQVVEPDSDVIEIGSKFKLEIHDEGEIEVADYVMSESTLPVDGFKVITPKTPVGTVLLGHKENDVIGKGDFTMIINKIYRPKTKVKQKTN